MNGLIKVTGNKYEAKYRVRSKPNPILTQLFVEEKLFNFQLHYIVQPLYLEIPLGLSVYCLDILSSSFCQEVINVRHYDTMTL
jgi:hypothetical protein